MDLKDFVLETIPAIVDATSELQETYAKEDILINPPSAQSGEDVYQSGNSVYAMRRVLNVEFDVAVTAAKETTGGAKAGIQVLSVEISGNGQKSVTAEQVSRVSFRVPLTLKPSMDEKKNIDSRPPLPARKNKEVA